MGAPKSSASKAVKRARRDGDGDDEEPAAAPAPAAAAAAEPAPAAAAAAPPQKKPKKGSSSYWSSLGGWKSIPVTDQEIFLGADEGGFGGIEELDPRDVDAAALAELDAQARALFGGGGGGAEGTGGAAVVAPGKGKQQQKQQQQQAKQQPQDKQAKKQSKKEEAKKGGGSDDDGDDEQQRPPMSRKERRAAERRAYREERLRQRADERRARRAEARAAREAGGEDLGALKARLAALERENARLKQQKPPGEGGSDSGDSDANGDDNSSDDDGDHQAPNPTAAAVDTSAWRRAFPGDWLHPELERALALAGFASPTPVQVAAVPGAARDRRDVICAAQTGSGKTLAFGLPILQRLLEERDRAREREEGEEHEEEEGDSDAEAAPAAAKPVAKPLRALILAPTRELGLQVASHLSALATHLGIRVAALVGGLALPKQERLLSKFPEVVVATPGRLWDLMRQAHPHVSDLSGLSFLVIDEADRMVQRGHYAELGGILDLVPRGGGGGNGGGGGKGVSGGKGGGSGGKDKAAARAAAIAAQAGKGLENEEVPALDELDPSATATATTTTTASANAPQTMVFSATLTLPASLRKRLRKGGGGQSGAATLDALMDRVPFRDAGAGGGRGPLIVDLTTARRLADRLHESQVRCATDARRDAALALFLSAHPGRCVVFVNAVSSLRRLAALLRLLGLPAQALHAQQQQRQRLKALDRFRASPQGVLVATDVAARGLDVKGVESVVHYQLPASADTYIHRCGRTARTGGGEGVSLALVTPQEAARWRALRFALGSVAGAGEGGGEEQDEPAPCPEFPLDGALLREAERRLAIAEKVDALERGARKRRAEGAWARSQAAAAGLALSDDEDGGGDGGGEDGEDGGGGAAALSHLSARDAAELARLRSQLAAAVAAPLQPAVSRKFFAGGASASLLLHKGKGNKSKGGAGAGEEGEDDPVDPDAATAAASDLAARLATNAAAAATKKNKAPIPAAGGGGKREQERQRREAEQRRQLKLDRLLLSNNERKRRRRAAAQGTGRGMVVIGRPGVGGSSAAAMAAVASGRQVGGLSALAALQQHGG